MSESQHYQANSLSAVRAWWSFWHTQGYCSIWFTTLRLPLSQNCPSTRQEGTVRAGMRLHEVTGQQWPHQTFFLPVSPSASQVRGGLSSAGEPTSHRWKQFYTLPVRARHSSLVKFPGVCCSFISTGAEAVEKSFAFWKDAFKPSSGFCGVCRDHLSRGRTDLADVMGLKTRGTLSWGTSPH